MALSRLRASFLGVLRRRPLVTNTLSYATLYTAAELSQQTFNKYLTPEQTDYDFASLGRMVLIGTTVYAPTLYFWYKLLDRKFAGTSMKFVLTKVAADQLTMTPILLATFYTLHSVLERKEDVFEELREKYWRTFVANQVFWCPAQVLNFWLVPSNLRVLYVASASLIWINVLCFIKRQKDTSKQH